MMDPVIWTLAVTAFCIVAVFLVAFAFKVAFLDHRLRKHAPGGFEVKPITGGTSVPREKGQEIDG